MCLIDVAKERDKCSSESQGSIKRVEFLDKLSTCQLLYVVSFFVHLRDLYNSRNKELLFIQTILPGWSL